MTEFIEATGAYGRTYTKSADVQDDWDAGKDFRNLGFGGTYLNREDAERMNLNVTVRYGKNLVNLTSVRRAI